MSTIKYIGRTTDFKGKSLWEIVSNLKNFGMGRVVVRSMFERYPEKSYMRILKVEAIPDEENRKVKVTVERVFRGFKEPKPIEIFTTSYKTDYRLLSKKEEAAYCEETPKQIKILPQHVEFPPLLKEFIVKETGNPDPKLKLKQKSENNKFSRIAKDGEKPTIEVVMSLGTPAKESMTLYEGIDLK